MASAPPDMLFKIMTRIHIILYRTSRGKIWKNMSGMPVLLLTTTGRKSGQPLSLALWERREVEKARKTGQATSADIWQDAVESANFAQEWRK